jgi:aminoglycoside 3-N-acetyltransferase
MRYNFNDIKEAYKRIGISKGMTISLKTDLRFLGPYYDNQHGDVLAAHFNALADLIDLREGNIVVSSASFSLCNTEKVFDVDNTPSEMGALTEYIRKLPGSRRSFHPFTSYAAIGKDADYICNNTSRHSVGPNSPKARLLELNAQCLAIGKHPYLVSMVIHHIEQTMGVPYRYVKEFNHPVLRNGKVIREPFYLFVRYLESFNDKVMKREVCRQQEVVNPLDRKVFPHFFKSGYIVREESLGRGSIYSYSMNELYSSTVQLLTIDLYACIEREPLVKPYCE